MTNLEDQIQKTYAPRRQFLKATLSGIAGGLVYLMGGNLFAAPDDLDLPIDPRSRQRAVEQTPPPPAWVGDDRPTFFGEAIYGAQQTIVYVIDRSGSMREVMGTGVDLQGRVRPMTRFQRGQIELKRSIMALAPNMRFNIVSYDCSVMAWQRGLVAATPENKREAYNWIDGLYPLGGTGTGMGVAYALRSEENRDVVLLTDGYPTCSLTIPEHRSMIQRCNPDRKRIHVFGISAHGPFREFCVRVASDSGGSYHDVR